MEVYHTIDLFKEKGNSVCTIGNFDGVHLGHQKILDKLDLEAKKNNCSRLLISFSKHPASVLQSATPLSILNFEEKVIRLKQSGKVDILMVLPFEKIRNYSFAEFSREILKKKLNVQKLIMGYDNHIGKSRKGDHQNVKKILPTQSIPPLKLKDTIISSTQIRKAISVGDFDMANKMLGYRYFLIGRVIKGQQIGRTINFPTANITPDPKKAMPPYGVYHVHVHLEGQTYPAILNFGKKPTLNTSEKTCLEIHIFDFDRNIYGCQIKITFLKFIRPEQKFLSLTALKEQIRKDIQSIFSG